MRCEVGQAPWGAGSVRPYLSMVESRRRGFGEKPRSHSARGQESAVICCSTVPGRTKEKMKGVVVVAFRFEKLERRSRVLRRIFLVAKFVQAGAFFVGVLCVVP